MRTSSSWATARGPGRREGDTTEARILHRAAFAEPYFALDQIVFDGTELRAHAATETDPGAETGAVSAAELARHAVVAGSSVIALGRPDPSRCYYLVSGIDAMFFPCPRPFGARVHYSALATELGPGGGTAQVEARVERELLGRLRVSYAMVPETLFTRLFIRHKSGTFGDTGSHKSYPPFSALTHERHRAEAWLSVATSDCRGHFEQHSALPVTVLFGQLVRLASNLTEGRFRVSSARVRSQALAWAGDELRLSIVRRSGPWNFSGRASTAGRAVATVDLCVVAAGSPAT